MAERPEDSRRHHKSSNRSGRCGKDRVTYLLRSGEHGIWAKRAAGSLSRRLSILGALLLVIFAALIPLGAGAQEEPSPPSSDSVWYAAGTSLVRVNTESGQAAGSVPLSSQTSPVSSLASHPTDGSVAVLAKGRLLGFDTSGNKTFEEPVAAASSLGTAPVLASDPHDGNLWVGGSGVIVLADARGQNQRTIKLNTGEVVKAISASQGGGAYALTQSRLLRLSKAGEVISQRPMSTVGVKSPTYLAVDEYGGLGYVANATVVAQVSLSKPGDPPIRKIKPNGGVGALSVNPFDGTLYVASRPSTQDGDREPLRLRRWERPSPEEGERPGARHSNPLVRHPEPDAVVGHRLKGAWLPKGPEPEGSDSCLRPQHLGRGTPLALVARFTA